MEFTIDPGYKQALDDVFDAFSMLAGTSYVSLMHVAGRVTRFSAPAVDLLGLPGEYVPNGSWDWNNFLHPEDRKRYMDVMTALAEGTSRTYDITYRVHTKMGKYITFRAMGGAIRGEDGKPLMIGGLLTNQGRAENVDPVTALPNRNAFLEDLSRRIHMGSAAFCMQVGVSRFSLINQSRGYTYGNRLLQEIAGVIQEAVKDRGTIYRLNGPVFAILLDLSSREEAGAIYDYIRYRLQQGVEVDGVRNFLTASGGEISTYHADAEADTIASCLNYAYHESKRRMHGELVDFNGSIHFKGKESLEMLNRLRDSITNGCAGFRIEYLPVISAGTERISGAEAIICWEDPKYGKVAAEDFLPILERDFTFEELGDFILEQSLKDGMRFLSKDPGFLLCVNVQRIQVLSNYFIDNLTQYLKTTGFPPRLLSLKFSSECRSIDTVEFRGTVESLHQLGIISILGSFGSGENSIVYLKEVPVDAVSVEMRFTRGIEKKGRDREILQHLTRMASTCVCHINVDGVENETARDIIRTMPVTTMHGPLYSLPLSVEALIEKYYS